MARSPWRLSQFAAELNQVEAQLERASLTACVLLGDPSRGLTRVSARGKTLGCDLLGVRTPLGLPAPNLLDAYARVGDLVATYSESPEWPFRVQIYWRECTSDYPGAIGAVELLASVQTDLLDTQPELFAGSRFSAGSVSICCFDKNPSGVSVLRAPAEIGRASAGCFIVRSLADGISYAELIHPADFRGSLIEDTETGSTSLKHRLFAERLEKGVILRARVLGLIVDEAHDLEIAGAAYESFCHAPPPLTT